MSSEVIASFAVTGQPHVHDSHPLFSTFNPGLHLSVEAVTAAGDRCPAPSAVGLPVEGATTTHHTT